MNQTIVVLTLQGTTYVEHGSFARGMAVTSVLLAGFSIAVDAVFDAA